MPVNSIINLDSTDAYNSLYGLKSRHPLVSVIDLKKADMSVNNVTMKYGIYALFLKNNASCSIKYGRRSFDCQKGTIVSFAPGNNVEVSLNETEITPDVVGLVFHPDLITGTPLGEIISSFGFFSYSQCESVHLSSQERETFLRCLQNIDDEISHPSDSHTISILASHIHILLEHLQRFYDRQFQTRHQVNSEIVLSFEKELRGYYADGASRKIIPNVSYFADKVNLSAGYFGDLVKKETGSSPKDLISRHILSVAKHKLASTNKDISMIADDLGFEYPGHFSRMFKRMTGHTPTQYRLNLSGLTNNQL